ncbi:lipoprotein N-acyltransferase Lnb domain-containing protein [Myroides pelagicus]|uniref:DUF4105 domain-containing protein n=1 Tax=Myroides pelagicus TaxID=270914 RepID=A0A7K1GL12_9FLAO|nr:DUF4105 domain-containing protein [Myroides pelagicus]MEC4114008.1 DUF4105 domain-containing protein [Myroides pelagicus]MTH29575.1 DUF4105 domain-containing protein [Myroides pelagicus]
MKHILYSLLVFLFSIQISVGQVESRQLSDYADVSVLTIGTGPMLHELFGHTAIRVSDPSQGIDRVYNFGMFDFATPNFGLRFIKGDMLYFADYTTMRNFIANYVYDNRSVYEQKLALTSDQKNKVWKSLNESLEEENKYYVYKFINQNCTTKVVDIVNADSGTAVTVDIPENQYTYREVLNSYLGDSYLLKLGINMILGSAIDQKNAKQFLPDKYMKGLDVTIIKGKPIVKEKLTIFAADQSKKGVAAWWDSYLVFSLLCLGLAFLAYKFRQVRSILLIVVGVFGVFFLFVNFYSLHEEVQYNTILLLCNPLLLLFPFIKHKAVWKKRIRLFLLISLTLYVVLNITSEKLVITLPIYLLTLWLLIIDRISVNKK